MPRQSNTPHNDPPYPTPEAGNPNAPNYLETAHGVIILDGQTGRPATFTTGTLGSAITFADSPAIDAFSRLRVSEPKTLFDATMQYDNNPLFWETQLTGAASVTHLPNESSVSMDVTTASGDKVIRQSRKYIRYQPGKSQLILLTGRAAELQNGLRQRMGYYDDQNGIFIEAWDSTVNVVLRSFVSGGVSERRVASPDWNIDPMDGTGPSGLTLDVENAQIMVIDIEWLAVGRVRIGFVQDGIIYYCHEFLNSNRFSTAYMTTANLPIRYELEATDTLASAATLKQICSMVASEGGRELVSGIPMHVQSAVDSVTAQELVLSIRPKLTFNSIVNRCDFNLSNYFIYSSVDVIDYRLVYGGAVAGGAWADVDTTYSAFEFNEGGTLTGGIEIDGGIVPASVAQGNRPVPGVGGGSLLSELPLTLDIAGAHPTSPLTDVLSIVLTSLAGATDTVAGFNWIEER